MTDLVAFELSKKKTAMKSRTLCFFFTDFYSRECGNFKTFLGFNNFVPRKMWIFRKLPMMNALSQNVEIWNIGCGHGELKMFFNSDINFFMSEFSIFSLQ